MTRLLCGEQIFGNRQEYMAVTQVRDNAFTFKIKTGQAWVSTLSFSSLFSIPFSFSPFCLFLL